MKLSNHLSHLSHVTPGRFSPSHIAHVTTVAIMSTIVTLTTAATSFDHHSRDCRDVIDCHNNTEFTSETPDSHQSTIIVSNVPYFIVPGENDTHQSTGSSILRHDNYSKVEWTTSSTVTTLRWSRVPIPYDPMLGWYTAATLSGLLLAFLACVGLDRVKQEAVDAWNRRRARQEQDRPTMRRKQYDSAAFEMATAVVEESFSENQFLIQSNQHVVNVSSLQKTPCSPAVARNNNEHHRDTVSKPEVATLTIGWDAWGVRRGQETPDNAMTSPSATASPETEVIHVGDDEIVPTPDSIRVDLHSSFDIDQGNSCVFSTSTHEAPINAAAVKAGGDNVDWSGLNADTLYSLPLENVGLHCNGLRETIV